MGEQKKSRKEILLEEIDELNHLIENNRKIGKDSSRLRYELIQLIIELDNMEKDNEYKST